MNTYTITVQTDALPHPESPHTRIVYHLLPIPAQTGPAWSILCIREEHGVLMESRLLYDLTPSESRANELFRLAVSGCVLPQELDEVLSEQEACF